MIFTLVKYDHFFSKQFSFNTYISFQKSQDYFAIKFSIIYQN